ncbi:3611_t:CDS:2 [Acaulospora morrowiae]|uniref:3611_t:CDS:1 n=1 Tax=Acaulospora morrowiae TaxID=94023 RepID=A0A9N8WI22_9GLOM|nr:3611_t:CDS:2 [Acaulospora morrowiae]
MDGGNAKEYSSNYNFDDDIDDYDDFYFYDDPMSISRLDKRRRQLLSEVDNANFSSFHIRACVVSGIGFFTDAYDLFVINLVSTMLGYTYFSKNDNIVPPNIDTGLKISAACGTLVGQLLFGWCADKYGRKKIYGLELSIMVFATIGSALCANTFAVTLWGALIFWRFILGIGIGGDYPLSAVITSEFATLKRRGAMIAAVFAMQGFGILCAAIVSLVVLVFYKNKIFEDPRYVDCVWRIVLGFGAVPGAIGLYFRLTIPETPRYTIDVERNIEQAAFDVDTALANGKRDKKNTLEDRPIQVFEAPRATWKDFKNYFSQWKNGKILLGTSISWFVLDVAFYGIGLNNSIILEAIGFAGGADVYSALWNMSVGNILITMLGTVPGYWCTVIFVDKWGRKPIQMMGFGVLTVLFLILGSAYNYIIKTSLTLFITIFSMCQFFQNFGPNATTFIVPGEVFPTRYRSTGHGISAASGKLGAIIAQFGFLKMKDINGRNQFVGHLIQIFSVFMLIGLFSTGLIPETKDKSLEELSHEEQTGFIKPSRNMMSGDVDEQNSDVTYVHDEYGNSHYQARKYSTKTIG